MNILRASHLGMCFGVRDAIALAFDHPEPTTILGDLVHNQTVLDDLQAHGVRTEQHLDAVTTPTVMITAHGAADRTKASLRARGLRVLEATCPLVQHAHRAVLQLAQAGYHPVIIGKREHVEVRGLTGDLDAFDVVLDAADITSLQERARFGVISQTTQPVEKVRCLVDMLRERFPRAEVRFVDTVCQPTKQRQAAAVELALRSDVVVVIGGAHSNNTRELVATCARYCAAAHQVQTAAELRADWFAGARTVGITAGTSTPDEIIDGVENWLRRFVSAPLAPVAAVRDRSLPKQIAPTAV